MLRKYSKTLTLMLIAAILYMGGFAVNILSSDVEKFLIANKLRPLLWGIVAFCSAGVVFLFVREHNAPESHVEDKADASAVPESDRENRRKMLAMVRRNWIEGVLYKSLWNQARLVLNLEGRPDAVVHPCGLALRRAGQSDTPIPSGTPILDVYRQEQEELLLLGEPGSGKTTLLLEITETLLQEAENDLALPIPVVFNLSAWRERDDRLDTWLVAQLNQDYLVPEKIGAGWVKSGALLLLLDGLDEVAESRRAACVQAINDYRQNHQAVLLPIVVCCRTQEYEAIPNLRLSGAVVIQVLTTRQVDDYLSDGGKKLSGLRAVLKDEPTLYRELFSTPLMLNVAIVTYEGQTAAALRKNVSKEERSRRLWDAYIERMFERKLEQIPQYDKTQALNWLAWLGKYLTRKDLQKYLIEGMQPDDLPRPWQTFIARWLLAILLNGIVFTSLYFINFGDKVITGAFCIWIAYGRNIALQPIRLFTPRNVLYRWKFICGMAVVGAAFISFRATFGAVVGAAVGAAGVMFEESVLENTVRPNEGIHHSLHTATFGAAVAVAVGAAVGAAVGVVVGLAYGGKTVLLHYILRFLLWRSERFPRNITAFLDWTAQRALVQRVGGGWKFVHRTLRREISSCRPRAHVRAG